MPDPKLQIILAAKDITGAALTKFQGRIAAITKSVFSFRGVLGSLAGAGGFGILINKSLETADAIGKTADKLGIGIGALQEYRYAAERSGVSTNTLDMALQRFTRRTAEAAQGKGELTAVLEQYNIAVRDSEGNTRRTEDVFRDLADVLQRTQDPAERLRIAFKAFDSEGAALVNMLRDGSGGLDEFAAKARDLGIVLDDDLIRGSEKAKDAVDDLGKVIEVSFSRVVLENVESITSAVEQLAKALGTVAKYAGLRSITGTASEGARLASQGLIDWDKFIKASFSERQRMVDEALGGSGIGPDGRSIVRKKITGQPAAAPPGGWLTPPPAAATAGGKSAKGDTLGRDFWQVQAEDRYDVQSRMYDVLAAQEEDHGNQVARIGEVARDFWQVQAEERYEVHSRGLDAIMEAEESRAAKLVEMTERTAWAMQENFSNLFFDAMQGEFKSLEDYANGILDTLSRAISDFLSQQLVEGLFGSLTKASGGGGLFASIAGALFASAKGHVFSPAGVTAFARGGVVSDPTLFNYAGGLGLMGERGAEAVMPLTRNRRGELGVRTEGAGGGNHYHFHTTVQAPEGRLPRESINQLQAGWAASMQRTRRRYG